MKSNVVIIHGAYGDPDENWFGWLKEKLNMQNIDCIVPKMPTPEDQELNRWLTIFDTIYSGFVNPQTILIGHSLGAAFVLRWLEQTTISINHAILVGAFLGQIGVNKFDQINQSFFATPFKWNDIKKMCQQFSCYHGSNDPYVSQDKFDHIADHLNARKIIISNGGHLNTAAGYTSFPQLLIHLKQIFRENYD